MSEENVNPIIQGDDQPREDLVFETPGGADAGGEILDVWTGDPEGAALHGELVRSFGGEDGFAVASQDLAEAAGIFDPEGKIGAALEGIPRSEEPAAIREMVVEWRGILASPEKSQAIIQRIYDHPSEEPGKSYFKGEASESVREGITRLWQSAHGEKPIGRPKPRGDY